MTKEPKQPDSKEAGTPTQSKKKSISDARMSATEDNKTKAKSPSTSARESNTKPQNRATTGSNPSVKGNSATASHASTNRFATLFAIVVAIVALLAAGWLYWQQQLLIVEFDTTKGHLDRTVDDLKMQSKDTKQSVIDLSGEVAQQAKTIELLSDGNQALRQQLVTTQDDLRRVMSKGRQEWRLDQALHYLELAQARIIIEKDKEVALALLREAASTLREISDLQLNTLLQLIQEDINYLGALAKNNDGQVLMALASLDTLIANLKPTAPQLKEIKELSKAENKAWFDRLMDTINSVVSDAVKFRTHEEAIKPLLTDGELVTVKTSMRLAIQQAQTAFSEGQTGYYIDRLNMAQAILRDYFQLNEQAKYLEQELKQLTKQRPFVLPEYQLTSLIEMLAIQENRRLQWLSDQNKGGE